MHSLTSAATKRMTTSAESRCYKHRSLITVWTILRAGKLYITERRGPSTKVSYFHYRSGLVCTCTHTHMHTGMHRHTIVVVVVVVVVVLVLVHVLVLVLILALVLFALLIAPVIN